MISDSSNFWADPEFSMTWSVADITEYFLSPFKEYLKGDRQ